MTNGEKIEQDFPKTEWTFDWKTDLVFARIDGVNSQQFDVNWWNAEYIESVDDYARTTEMLAYTERALETRCPVDEKRVDNVIRSMAH